jgi:hypothetical protein
MGSQLDPLPLSRVGSRERLSESLFPQLHFGEPSSGFTPGLGSASLCTRLDFFHPLIVGVSHCICNQPLDPMGIHLVHCAHGEEKTTLHDFVRDAFATIVRNVRFHVPQEHTHFLSPFALLFF